MHSAEPSTFLVEKLVPGGQGYARLADGRVALISAVAPGDRIEVTKSIAHKGYLEVEQWRMVEPSAGRVEPPCPVAARCGGCDWMMLNEQTQRDAKLSILREALTRTGKLTALPEAIEFIASPSALAYRSRIRLQVSHTGKVGFFSAQSHDLVEAAQCGVADAHVNAALTRLREVGLSHAKALGSFAHVEIRSAPNGTVSLFFQRIAEERTQSIDCTAFFAELQPLFTVCTSNQEGKEAKWQRYPLPGNIELKAPPGTFTQVNWEVNLKLIESVVSAAKDRKLGRFLELYCGSGNFTLPLLASGFVGIGVETNRAAVAAAISAAGEYSLAANFQNLDVAKYLEAALERGDRFDWVLIDPPRAGIKSGLDQIVQLKPRYIAICSCDPVTLARDVRGLVDRGYALETVTAFDMFPQTHHLETLVWLKRIQH